MTATPEYYAGVVEAFYNLESLTILVVAGATIEQVAAAVSADLASEADPDDIEDYELTAWAFLDIPGGLLGVEHSGYGDPSLTALRTLSGAGGSAAVVRGNIQAHFRFGAARDGEILFDDDECMYIEDPEVVPAELRPLFDLIWDDLEGEVTEEQEGPGGFEVALAMAELVTGLALTAEQVAAVQEAPHYSAPAMQYVGGDG